VWNCVCLKQLFCNQAWMDYFRETNCVSCGVDAHNKESIRQVNYQFLFREIFYRVSGMNDVIKISWCLALFHTIHWKRTWGLVCNFESCSFVQVISNWFELLRTRILLVVMNESVCACVWHVVSMDLSVIHKNSIIMMGISLL